MPNKQLKSALKVIRELKGGGMNYILFLQNLKTLSNKGQIHLFKAGQLRRGCYWWVTRHNLSKSQWRKLCIRLKEFGFEYRGYAKDLASGWFREIGYITRDKLK